MNMANSAVRIIIKIKRIPIKAIIDIKANIFIIIFLVIKKLKMIIGILNESRIIVIDQTKKNVIKIVRDASLSI